MAQDIQSVHRRVATSLEAAAERERALGRDGFATLPRKLQEQLAVLQEQADPGPGEPTLEMLLALDHALGSYRRKLDGAIDIRRQIENESGRRATARATRRRRRALGTAAAVAVLVGGGLYAKRELAMAAEACATASGCAEEGACGSRFVFEGASVRIACAPRDDEDCAAAAACTERGRCLAGGERCMATPETCEARAACEERGACSVVEGDCRPATVADCRRTTACTKRGWCTPIGGTCVAGSDADCRQSNACQKEGACLMVDQRCVKPPEGFDEDE